MARSARSKYDEDLLVKLLAQGQLTREEIARRVGLSARTVRRIASGASRPDLHEKVRNYGAICDIQAVRIGKSFVRPLLMTQLKVAMEPKGETQRKAREFLLNRLLFLPTERTRGDGQATPVPMPLESIPGLEEEDLEAFYSFKASAEKIVPPDDPAS
jgi:transcriptional regulator with XRE-family HTH domain